MAVKKTFFEPVETNINFPEVERKLVAEWYKKGTVKKYLKKNANSKKYFSFIDGPITANNPMGVHHAWGRTYKDLWQKFKNMQGFKERFQNGFDCQGLWVEVEVEKELEFTNKKDIEKFGIAKFVDLCRERVKKYSNIQTEQTKRLGNFMDWDHSYFTLSDENNYMIWHFLKKCHQAGWIYKGNDSVPWCPRCETAISQHEMLTEDYKELTHKSVYLAFPIFGQENEYLLVWTTTPWTIIANVAVAVDEKLTYSQILVGDRKYWLAKDAVERVFTGVKYKEIKTTLGSKLVGLRYRSAFDDLPNVIKAAANDKFHTVIPTDNLILPITTTEGTGMVHTAVSAGSEDFKLGKKLGLPIIPVIEDDASYLPGLGEFSGLNAKKHPEVILDYLTNQEKQNKHFVFKIEDYTHRYPACWRCKTELVWKVTDEWYIAMDLPSKSSTNFQSSGMTLRQRMIDVAKRINWIPGFGLDRELDWLTNMNDWLISKKNRYWGLALPIWECSKCHNFEVIGSKEELNERSITGNLKGSPHKPQVDKILIKCPKCDAEVTRIEPVGNPWLDAGIVPFSTISKDNTKPLYLSDRKEWLKWFPADFITESFPGQFKNWFYSLIAMSTVLEDMNPMKTVLGFATMTDSQGRGFHKSLGNAIEFVEGADKAGADVIRWMAVRQNPSENLQFGYELADEVRRRFHLKLWNVYNFFVTYANLDGYRPAQNFKIKLQGSNVLDKWIIARLNKTVNLVTGSLEKYDAFAASLEIEKFVDDLSLWYIRRSRERVGPVAESEKDRNAFYNTTYYVLTTLCSILAPFNPFLSELIFRNLTKEESVHLSNWPKSGLKVNEELIKEMEKARNIVERGHALRKNSQIPVRQPLISASFTGSPISKSLMYLVKDELNIKDIIGNAKSDKLDTRITKELEEEALVREIVRKIQEERKKLGLNLHQKVNVSLEKVPRNKKLVTWLIKKAQVDRIVEGKFNVQRSLV